MYGKENNNRYSKPKPEELELRYKSDHYSDTLSSSPYYYVSLCVHHVIIVITVVRQKQQQPTSAIKLLIMGHYYTIVRCIAVENRKVNWFSPHNSTLSIEICGFPTPGRVRYRIMCVYRLGRTQCLPFG